MIGGGKKARSNGVPDVRAHALLSSSEHNQRIRFILFRSLFVVKTICAAARAQRFAQ